MDISDAEVEAFWSHYDPARGVVAETKRALAAAYAARWRPIDTAPLDAVWILLTDGHYVRTGSWYSNRETARWGNELIGEPTHWQPLPPPPTTGDHNGSRTESNSEDR